MNLHPNARTTPFSRKLLIDRIELGEPVRAAAEAVGVSRSTAYKWWTRYREEGIAGLQDRSSEPRHIPHKTSSRLRRRIEDLRRKRWTGRAIAARLGLVRSTAFGILRRMGLGLLRALTPPPVVRRYEKKRPGELLHLDIKKLGRFRRPGHRVTGRSSGYRRSRGVGWDFVHVCVDDYTRLASVEVLPDERKETATGFLKRAATWFRRRGVRIERVLTENGSCYRSHLFRDACVALGAKHSFPRPTWSGLCGMTGSMLQKRSDFGIRGRLQPSSAPGDRDRRKHGPDLEQRQPAITSAVGDYPGHKRESANATLRPLDQRDQRVPQFRRETGFLDARLLAHLVIEGKERPAHGPGRPDAGGLVDPCETIPLAPGEGVEVTEKLRVCPGITERFCRDGVSHLRLQRWESELALRLNLSPCFDEARLRPIELVGLSQPKQQATHRGEFVGGGMVLAKPALVKKRVWQVVDRDHERHASTGQGLARIVEYEDAKRRLGNRATRQTPKDSPPVFQLEHHVLDELIPSGLVELHLADRRQVRFDRGSVGPLAHDHGEPIGTRRRHILLLEGRNQDRCHRFHVQPGAAQMGQVEGRLVGQNARALRVSGAQAQRVGGNDRCVAGFVVARCLRLVLLADVSLEEGIHGRSSRYPAQDDGDHGHDHQLSVEPQAVAPFHP
ncbi:MAG: leucine zipper domain-containing protein [Planctomycetota bacterium]